MILSPICLSPICLVLFVANTSRSLAEEPTTTAREREKGRERMESPQIPSCYVRHPKLMPSLQVRNT